MFLTHRISSRWIACTFLTIGMLGLGSTPLVSAADPSNEHAVLQQKDIREVQKRLSNKGFDTGPTDGFMGPRTREGIRQFQESKKLPVTGNLDVETAGKLGVGPESIGGEFAGAGHDVAEGSKELGHEVKQGKPVAAAKEFGKGIGGAAQKVGEGVVDAVSPDSDRGDREEQKEEQKQEGTEADHLKRENDAHRAASQADLDRAVNERVNAEADKTELRAQLLRQFSTILETRDTSRGLIINMSDVLFDTAKYSLGPVAREKLAKVAGVVSRHPGLTLEVEGHTDSIGEEDYNQRLSEQRGEAVRTYLIEQGVAQNSVTTRGFGGTQPAASNRNAAGRRQNRRVELVVSGDIIGGQIGTPTAAVR